MKSSNKFTFYKFFYKFFFIYIKLPKNLSAKFYQENKERLQKKARERYKNLSKEEKEKKQQYGREHYKKINWLSIEKIIIEQENMLYHNYKEVF